MIKSRTQRIRELLDRKRAINADAAKEAEIYDKPAYLPQSAKEAEKKARTKRQLYHIEQLQDEAEEAAKKIRAEWCELYDKETDLIGAEFVGVIAEIMAAGEDMQPETEGELLQRYANSSEALEVIRITADKVANRSLAIKAAGEKQRIQSAINSLHNFEIDLITEFAQVEPVRSDEAWKNELDLIDRAFM